jgi:hypothetical protein
MTSGTLNFSSNDNTYWLDGVAEDGEGGSINLANAVIQVGLISNANGSALNLPIEWKNNAELFNTNGFNGLTTFDPAINDVGWAGFVIKSAAGSEFQINSFQWFDWGNWISESVKVAGYRDGQQVASSSFASNNGDEFITVNLDPSFDRVDEIRITYADGAGWGTINNIEIADPPPPPKVTSVTSSSANGPYKAGQAILISVTFDQAVDVNASNGTPTLWLETGSTDRAAVYTGGSGTPILTFSYTVQPGDTSADLDYLNINALSSNGATIKFAGSSVDATLALPAPGAAGSLGATKAIQVDTTAPTLAITSNRSTLKTGETATITFTFSEDPGSTFTWNGGTGDVLVSGGTLSAISGSGTTRTATFTPSANVNGGTASISVAAGSYADAAGNAGGGGSTPSLSFDTLAPQVMSITRVGSETSNATSVQYTVIFDSSVTGVDASDFQLTGTGTGTVAGVTGSGTTYTVTVNDVSGDGTLRLDLKNTGTGITDAAGNAAPGFTGGQTYIFDHTAPIVTSVAVPAAATYRAGDPLELTVNFSEAVFVDTTGGTPSIPLSLDTGGVVHATYVSGSGSTALKFQYTVVAGNADANGILVAGEFSPNGGAIRDAVGNDAASALNSVAPTSGVLVNALAPTVTSVVRDGAALTNATSVSFIVTFSESVQGVDASDFTLAGNGASGSIASVSGSGRTWTVVVDDIGGDGTLRLDLNASGTGIVASSSGQVLAGGFTSGEPYTLDFAPPVLDGAITISDSALKIGDSATVTFRFTEAVKDFTIGDVTVPNGELSNLTTSDGGITWTATLTPNDGASAAGNALTLNYAGVTDLAGNANTGSASSGTYAIDTVRPHLASTIAISEGTLAIGGSATVTFTFNEAVTGFTITDVTAPNGTLSNLASSDGGITWTATLTPSSGVNATGNVLTLNYAGIADLAGNAGSGTATSDNYAVDTVRPVLLGNISISRTVLRAGESATVDFTFSEAVINFGADNVIVQNATLTDFRTLNGGLTWSATLVPDAGITDASNVLTMSYAGVTDLAGNGNDGAAAVSSANYAVSTVRPELAKPIEISTTTLGIGGSATVTFTFTEPVLGFDVADVTVPGARLSLLTTTDGITWTATLTPDTLTTTLGNVVTLDLSGVINSAGNTGAGTVESHISYDVDTVRPGIVDIEISDAALASGETATVTFTFSEAVTGFTAANVTVPNGTLSALASSDGGTTWTAILTPDQGTRGAANVLEVDLQGITDLAGNAGGGTARSDNYAIDTTAPVLASPILIDDVALKIGDSATVTFVFDQAVQGFTAADVTVPNGVLTDLVSSDGITWTATLTPNQGASAASNVLTLDYSGITNLAGNAGIGTASSASYAVDTRAPTATVTLNDIDLRAGETATVTVTFSEIVSGFDKSAVSAPNGILGDFVTSDGGKTWSATFTPSVNTSAATNVMSVSLAGVSDEAGNPGAGSTTSPSYAVQTKPPVIPPTNPPATIIDGVQVERTETVNPDGSRSQVVTIPVVTPGRNETDGAAGYADIPLVSVGGRPVLLAQLPVGYGLQVSGPSAPQPAGSSLTDLIRAIKAHTLTGSADQNQLTGGGSGFLQGLSGDTPLVMQTIVPMVAPSSTTVPGQLLVISGLPAAVGMPQTALVIDTRGLPSGSHIELQNVNFAVVIGAVTVTGGAGSQVVYGDGANQSIVLGADDDELHGGGGDDYIGSHGGNDWLYGDDGNDTVSGGEGNDRLFGGNGDDRLEGGSGHDKLYGNSGNDTLSGGAGNDSLWGGSGADRLDGGAGNDTLKGEAGHDRITGGLGRDKLWGGSGKDVFDFNSAKESKVGSQRDIIYDFKSGQDRIDLRDIDANTLLKGNQKFAWTGSEAPFLSPKDGSAFLKAGFTGKAGELRYENGLLIGDVNGDGRADFQIKIVGKFAYSDVIL